MIGILIISHENFGDSLIHCATHVMGEKQPRLMYLGVFVQDDPDVVITHAQDMVRQLDCGDGVLVLSDIYGATPCNIASRLIEPGRVECLAGVNLPMLIRVLTYRDKTLAIAIEKAMSGGREGIINAHLESCNAA